MLSGFVELGTDPTHCVPPRLLEALSWFDQQDITPEMREERDEIADMAEGMLTDEEWKSVSQRGPGWIHEAVKKARDDKLGKE